VILFSGDTGLRGRRPGFGPLSLRSDQTGHRGLGEQSDQAYASSSCCNGKRACACAPKASAADARVKKIAAARMTGSGLPPARGSDNQRPAHVPRTPPVAVTAGAGLRAADAANGPVGNIRVLNTSAGVEGATAGPARARPVPRTPVCDWRRPLRGPRPRPRLRRSPPRHVARCTSPCRAVAVGCDCHPWASRAGHEGLRLQLHLLERGYTARQLGGCA